MSSDVLISIIHIKINFSFTKTLMNYITKRFQREKELPSKPFRPMFHLFKPFEALFIYTFLR